MTNDSSEEEEKDEEVGEMTWRRHGVAAEIRTLTRNPRNIHELWDEWQFGIGNRRATKDFDDKDRGRCKYTFHRRKVAWDKISEMVRSGWNSAEACNRIYTVYGRRSSITTIINVMRKDRKTCVHPALRSLNIEHV